MEIEGCGMLGNFSKNGRQIKKLKQKPGEKHLSRIFSQ